MNFTSATIKEAFLGLTKSQRRAISGRVLASDMIIAVDDGIAWATVYAENRKLGLALRLDVSKRGKVCESCVKVCFDRLY